MYRIDDPALAIGTRRPRRSPVAARRWLFGTQTGLWIVLVVLVVGPLLPLIYTSFLSKPYYLPGHVLTIQPYKTLLKNTEFWVAARNTLFFSLLATAIGVTIGAIFAVLCARTDMPGRRLYGRLILAPLVIPPLGLIVGWVAIYSKSGYMTGFISHHLGLPVIDLSSLVGMSLLGGSIVVPIVFLTCTAALTSADSSLEDAARSAGAGPIRTLTRVTLPMLRPAILNSALIVFALSVEVLGIPLFLGAPTHIDFLASFLYKEWTNGDVPDPPFVSAGAVLFLVFVSCLLMLRRRILGAEERFVATGSRGGGGTHPVRLGRVTRAVSSAAMGAFLLLTCAIPVLGLVVMSGVSALTAVEAPWHLLSGNAWHQVATDVTFRRSIVNSLVIAAVGGAIAVAFVAVVAVLGHRSRHVLRSTVPAILTYPRSIPGIVIGVGFFWSFLILGSGVTWLRTSLWGEGLALCVHNVTLAYLVIYPSLVRLNIEHDRAAQSVGASWWRTMRTITLPGIRPALIAAYILMFISLLNDYDPVVFLARPGTEILGVTMLQYWQQGIIAPVAALSVVQVVIVALALSVGALLARRSKFHA